MRKIIGVAVSCLVACSLFLIVQPAFGATSYNADWVPNESEAQFTIELSLEDPLDPAYSFGIYNWGENPNDSINRMVLFSGSGLLHETLTFSLSSEVYSVSNISGSSLTLGNTDQFGFFFASNTAGNNPVYLDYEYALDSVETYKVFWTNPATNVEHEIFVHDAAPNVPIPTAMLLLSSGLVGLAGFKRKMDN